MDFNRSRLLNNINILIAIKKLKKNEVETNSGVSVGYLSRLAKPDNDTVPSVDFVWRVARELGVTMDALIDYDFTKLNEEQLLITNFINELARKTDKRELDWNIAINDRTLAQRLNDGDYQCPLISWNSDFDYYYDSRFYKYLKVDLAGHCYDAELPSGGRVYVMDVEGTVNNLPQRFWEVYYIEDRTDLPFEGDDYYIVPICVTVGAGHFLEPIIDELASKIEDQENELKISREAKDVISRFMTWELGQRNN